MTLTLEDKLRACLDRVVTEAKQSRSAAAELIISDYLGRQQQAELARQAAVFFAQPETSEEAEERTDWEALSLEVLSRDDPVAPTRCDGPSICETKMPGCQPVSRRRWGAQNDERASSFH